MVLTLAVLFGIMVVAVGATGMCSFEPGRPENGPVREVDAATFLEMESASQGIKLVNPQVPEGWTPNSARRSAVGDEPAATIGYVTDHDGYLQITQTRASIEQGAETEGRSLEETREIAGMPVAIYSADDSDVRDVWAIDSAERRVFITGAAEQDDWEALVAGYAAVS
ncbi:hypothetical protein CATYP_03720 [Corynebacterium atypicum]|uniref:DUF4245 domain-containing protein n=2 Tax=Corynebacterium atypicum TaxID=191610 RepID=A0ABM5QMA6_9CORY|nr:hypothetical protein CATYP_03720 [Corynebacterium atypicum]